MSKILSNPLEDVQKKHSRLLSMQLTKNGITALFLTTACVLAGIRALAPLVMNGDPSTQIGTAIAFFNGDGFGTYILNADISQPPAIMPLTWFPPGYSLLIAGLLKLGIPLATALKAIYCTATIVGWFGWSLIFREVVLSYRQTLISQIVLIALGVVLPLYYTYDWVGTDLILWAGIPLILRLFYATYATNKAPLSHYFWVGCLVGLMYMFRYAAAFLLVAFFLFFLVERTGFKKLMRILLGFAVFYLPISLYRMSVKTAIPSQFKPAQLLSPQFLLSQLMKVITALQEVKMLFFSHLTHKFPFMVPLAVFAFFVIVGFAVITVVQSWKQGKPRTLASTRLQTILCLNFGLIIFLAPLGFLSSIDFNYLGDVRYYYPLFPSMTLVAYEASLKPTQSKLDWTKLFKLAALFYLGLFLVCSLFMMVRYPRSMFGVHFFFAPRDIVEYPSNAITNRDPVTTQKIVQLLKQDPEAMAISFAEDLDFGHLQDMQVRKRFMPASYFEHKFRSTHRVGRPMRVYLIFGIEPNCASYCYYDHGKEVEFVKQLKTLKPIYRNDKENLNILVTELPKGFQFTLSSPD
jgi:hypothetical protein